MRIRRYENADWDEWLRMSRALFPGLLDGDLADMRATLARPDAAVFVIDRETGGPLAGYVEVGERSVADGCPTGAVGYIEAWYVDPDLRRSGQGRALIEAAEDWARAQGYREMASDALIDNTVSHLAHRRIGFEEVDRVVTYRKSLGP